MRNQASLFEQYGTVPVTTGMLCNALKDYKSPPMKLRELVKQGRVISLRRGLYVCVPDSPVIPPYPRQSRTDSWQAEPFCLELIANHIVSPSYVSYETVLSRAGIIPERAYVVRSACSQKNQNYENELGAFHYIRIPLSYYGIGVEQGFSTHGYTYSVATPEKALCDLIVSTRNLRIQSFTSMHSYLFDFLRIDEDLFAQFDATLLQSCVATTSKRRRELSLLAQTLSLLTNQNT